MEVPHAFRDPMLRLRVPAGLRMPAALPEPVLPEVRMTGRGSWEGDEAPSRPRHPLTPSPLHPLQKCTNASKTESPLSLHRQLLPKPDGRGVGPGAEVG